MISREKNEGFTLLELLVVIAIIGILAAVLIFGVRAQIAKGRDAKRKADLRKSQNALEDYYNDNGGYPSTFDCDESFTPYLEKVPCDPQPRKEYKYVVGPDNQWYKIYANLEYESDPAIAEGGCSTGCIIDDETYDYGVSSANVSL